MRIDRWNRKEWYPFRPFGPIRRPLSHPSEPGCSNCCFSFSAIEWCVLNQQPAGVVRALASASSTQQRTLNHDWLGCKSLVRASVGLQPPSGRQHEPAGMAGGLPNVATRVAGVAGAERNKESYKRSRRRCHNFRSALIQTLQMVCIAFHFYHLLSGRSVFLFGIPGRARQPLLE